MSGGPNYDLTGKELFCFSDEEGGNPFRFPSEQVSTGDDLGIPEDLESKFTLAEGMITGIKDSNVALGFLGDLVDNEAYSIRVLQHIIKVKEANPDRVILIGGNRDFNKLRMGIELYIQEASGYLPWYNVSDIKGLIERLKTKQFVFRKKDVPEYLKGVLKGWTDNMEELERVYTSGTIKQRVETMYGKTLGAVLQTLKNEIKILIGYPNFADDAVFAKLICTLQMVMGFEWPGLPAFLQPYNGLYIKYLRHCHVIASFKINGKLGVMSHGGLPHNFENKGVVSHRLTSPFGFKYNESMSKASLTSILTEIEAEKMALVAAVQGLRDTGYNNENTDDVNDLIDKYVHLTALTDLGKEGASSEASPIVGLQPVPIQNRRGDILVKFTGGSATGWIGRQISEKKGIKRLEDGTDLISYDIFGHAPQGFLPTAYRQSKTLYVNLDISKADGQANNLSFAFLHIKQDGTDEFIGRIKFTKASGTTVYKNSATTYTDKIYYYKEDIPTTGAISKLSTRDVPGLSGVTISYEGRTRTITATTVAPSPVTALGGRRKSRHNKKTHKKRGKGKRKTHRRR